MEYQKTNVNSFLGLDNNLRPELIKNEEASDIENLRFEKLGYLINRNGAENKGIYMVRQGVYADISGVLYPIGSMGMTEYVIQKPWGIGSGTQAWVPYDDATHATMTPSITGDRFTDRFMVYSIRIPSGFRQNVEYGSQATDVNNNSARTANGLADNTINRYTWRYKAAYILVPLTGPSGWKDAFAFAPNGVPYDPVGNGPNNDGLPSLYATIGSRSILRADDKPSRLQIYAPSRWLGVHNLFSDGNTPKDLNWIEHYVSMNQYRDSVVISDMTNGDMYLVDEYSESEYTEVKRHRFALRENSLAKFDVDDVVIDFGIGGSNFNEGVEAPMALYKFYLTRNRLESTTDNYQEYYVGREESPRLSAYRSEIRKWNMKDPLASNTSVFIASESWQSFVDRAEFFTSGDRYLSASGVAIDNVSKYVFSNNSDPIEYNDLFSPLTLRNPDIKDEQIASDIYLWKDFKIKYYTSSGIDIGQYFLRDKDRDWNRTSSSGTKLIKLKTKTGFEQEVPLGVWRYRFVWYLGNGEYSSPSSELIVPDLLFSGISDSDITSANSSYSRPFNQEDFYDFERTSLDLTTTSYINKGSNTQGIRAFSNAGVLTKYGEALLSIKKELYDSNHVFSARYSSTNGLSWPSSWTTESILAKSQLSVICDLMWQNDTVECRGVIAETSYTNFTASEDYNVLTGVGTGWYFKEQSQYVTSALPLSIPIFPKQDNSATYNSVFSGKYGFLRTAYQNVPRNVGNGSIPDAAYSVNYPSYSIVYEGHNRFGGENINLDANSGKKYVGSDVNENGKSVWFNVNPFAGGYIDVDPVLPFPQLYVEWNNRNDDDDIPNSSPTRKFWEYRNSSILRGVLSESDRLLTVKSDIDTEVISRLIVTGIGQIQLCDFGDIGTFQIQRSLVKQSFETEFFDRLGYALKREFVQVQTTVSPGSLNYLFALSADFSSQQSSDYRSFIVANGLQINSDYLKFSNIRVVVSAKGERLTIPEQLSMYIPASLLFEAPHVKIVIPANRVPRRARQLMIFRTRATHDNAWQPHEYGLVKAIDIIRDGQTWALTGNQASEISFLDDVKSSDLDYSYSLPDYDGFTVPLKSRFCLPLNERVFYANIKEAYRPHAPRSLVNVQVLSGDTTSDVHKNRNYGSSSEMQQLWSYKIFTDTTSTTNINQNNLYYFAAYNDQARSFSLASFSGLITRSTSNQKPVLFCMPSAYDPAIEQINIYRLNTATPLSSVTFTDIAGLPRRYRSAVQYTTGIFFVAQGMVEYNGVVYYPNSIIQAFHGGDSGYVDSNVNYMWSYFETENTPKNRGYARSYSQPIVYDITEHLDQYIKPNGVPAAGPFIEKIGTLQPEDEGVFYDNDLPSLGRLPIKQIFQNEDQMPSAVRWSEPYQQNKIKLASLMEVRAGDGDQITGLAMLYGNLIVLKERSIHRLAVQGSQVPVSRVDEISNNVGCIAPNTVITVNNTLYFLSWAGFYKYDNNTLSKIDGKFAEELQLRLRSAQNGVSNPAIRDASCGWNPTYRELYLTIPIMTTENNEGSYEDYNPLVPPIVAGTIGVTLTDNIGPRRVRGMVYAINIDTGMVTKHRYMDDSYYHTDPPTWVNHNFPLAPTQRAPRTTARLYYTNTLGQMRSAEILPPRTIQHAYETANPNSITATDASYFFMRSLMYLESPTKFGSSRDKANDDYLVFSYSPSTLRPVTIQATKFIRVFWASKDWTAEDKSVLKRIRKVFAHIAASDQPTIIRGIVHTSPSGPRSTTENTWQYEYIDSRPTSPRFNYSVTGELMSIPTESAGQSTSPSQNRGERHTFNIEGSGSFQMEYFGFYWKPINQYER